MGFFKNLKIRCAFSAATIAGLLSVFRPKIRHTIESTEMKNKDYKQVKKSTSDKNKHLEK